MPIHFSPATVRRRAMAALLGLALAGAAAGQEPLRLVVRAPPELAPVAREIERLPAVALAPAVRLTGVSGGPPILVVLAPESSATARATPPWISGYATGDGVIVLLPARVDRYPNLGLVPLLRHEVTHVLIGRAVRGGDLPRWFGEGLAMAAGREWDLGDRARVALAVLTDARLPLARLDSAFSGSASEVHAAYALAGDLVRELLLRHGHGIGPGILARVGRGERFAAAFHAETGQSLADFESAYWRRRTLFDRWLPVISSSVVLWGGIALLALAAFRRRRRRDAERLRRWDEEEALLEPLPDSVEGSGDDR